MTMKDPLGRVQCFWMPPWLVKLYAERATYERVGRPRAVIMEADIEAELAEVARLRGMPDERRRPQKKNNP
jgi:hypothetical protein